MFARLKRLTNPAAAAASTRPLKISWIMGLACSRIPMPAVTFTQSMIQSSQNCGVRIASFTSTFAVVTNGFDAGGVQPAGCQPGAGTRTLNAPNIMNAK